MKPKIHRRDDRAPGFVALCGLEIKGFGTLFRLVGAPRWARLAPKNRCGNCQRIVTADEEFRANDMGQCQALIESERSPRRGEQCRARAKTVGRWGHGLCFVHETASGIGR